MGERPLVMSCGDPSGIGPEISAKAWDAVGRECPFVWLGDPQHLPEGVAFRVVDDVADCGGDVLPVVPVSFAAQARAGHPEPANAAGVIDAIRRGAELVQSGAARGLVTCPIHKAALKAGVGFGFPGHTEYLAHLAGVDRVVMMLASDALRVVPVTIHIPLAEVPGALTPDLLEATIRITHAALIRDFGIARPRLAVAGLNPHAGEDGTMGHEDREVIAPVIARLCAEGMDLRGPLPADTMFHGPARARYDAALCMYHDQALIPIKTLAFDEGVNVTLGLPFVRTSPDHGTAYDIAGQDVARPDSLIAAIRMAWEMGA
ncbi:4-hydroxythreonine-4-phosphate dehydrogenase PdxA [Roseinatronobacter sp.]|uniref:4-hydroxythreonine-4-phosphate dehydrogenase PdxA n=1 Tax=Roseinatronobacter sp. TaxID=1945755 RepID=UPI0025F83315|nr:4-hydroxythreonine-4-phosphate dehydrogenase PdxA [Roseibaca sp.]